MIILCGLEELEERNWGQATCGGKEDEQMGDGEKKGRERNWNMEDGEERKCGRNESGKLDGRGSERRKEEDKEENEGCARSEKVNKLV